MTSRKEDAVEEIPEKLYDDSNKITYKRLRFFGKVSFTLFTDKNEKMRRSNPIFADLSFILSNC
jgi:hypothetical protein